MADAISSEAGATLIALLLLLGGVTGALAARGRRRARRIAAIHRRIDEELVEPPRPHGPRA